MLTIFVESATVQNQFSFPYFLRSRNFKLLLVQTFFTGLTDVSGVNQVDSQSRTLVHARATAQTYNSPNKLDLWHLYFSYMKLTSRHRMNLI